MTILDAIIQGIIQGLAEFLPISSSGHLSLYQYFTGLGSEDGALFSLVLHAGTLIAVIVAFWETIWELFIEFFKMLGLIITKQINWQKLSSPHKMISLLVISLLPLFFTLIVKDAMQYVMVDNDIIIEGICFVITAVLLGIADSSLIGRKTAKEMSYKNALTIGAMQAIAPLPGISRSGSTLSVAMMLGLDRNFAVAFSFIMGIPAVFAALLLDVKDILGGTTTLDPVVMIVGMVIAAIFGLLAIGMVRWLVDNNMLRIFSCYTLALGSIVIIIGVIEQIYNHPIQQYIISLLA